MSGDKKNPATHFAMTVLVIALLVAVVFLFHVLFGRNISDLTVEIMAAILGVVLVVASVGVTIHFQHEAEKRRQFQFQVFQTKLKLYQELLDCIMKSDDDNTIDKNELAEMRNQASVVALVASADLLTALAAFIERVSQEGQLAPKDGQEGEGTYRCVIQKMRDDLAVVDGNVECQVQRLIAKGGLTPAAHQSDQATQVGSC